MQQNKDKNSIIDNAAEYTGNATGAVVGGIVGGIIGGAEGAVAGSLASTTIEHLFRKMGSELKNRTLAPLEEQRVGSAYAKAKDIIKKRIAQGDTPRNDNFFNATSKNRSASEELLEGTLLAAQREHEEKKNGIPCKVVCKHSLHSRDKQVNGKPSHKAGRTTNLSPDSHPKQHSDDAICKSYEPVD